MNDKQIQTFDFSNSAGYLEGKQLRQDIRNVRNITSLEEVNDLMERIKSAIADIETAIKVSASQPQPGQHMAQAQRWNLPSYGRRVDASDAYAQWKQRAEFSLERYKASLKIIDGRRHALILQDKARRDGIKRHRLQDSLIAAQRKLEEAGIQALYQTSKTRAFITILKNSGLIPQDKWRQMWDDAEQLAFNSRHEFENVQLPQLKAKVESIFTELESLNSKDAG